MVGIMHSMQTSGGRARHTLTAWPSTVVAASLRRHAEAVRREAIGRHRVGSIDSSLLDEVTSSLVEAVLAPVLATLDSPGADRQLLADAVSVLFALPTTPSTVAARSSQQSPNRHLEER